MFLIYLCFLYPDVFFTTPLFSTKYYKILAVQSDYSVKEREGKGESLRDRKDGDKEDIGWKERRGQGERDRSDRVAYNVVAGSRKEQQIQWLYRPSPV